MKRAATLLAALAAILTAAAEPVRTATENFVTNKIAAAVAAIPAPDYSTNNAALVETIRAKAPAPDLTPATNYTDEVVSSATNNLRAKADLVYRNDTHNGIEKWVVTIQGETATLTAVWDEDFQGWLNMEPPILGIGIRIAERGYILGTTGGDFPFTVSGGSATVNDGWYTYTLAPVGFPEDRLALVSETATIARKIGAATNALAGNLASATNTLSREIEGIKQMIAADGEWNRPGEWTLGFSAIPTTPTILAYTIETNQATGVIVSNATVTEAQSLAAHVFSFSLDEFAHTPAPAVSLTCDAPGATIEGDVLTATANGVYTVLGTSTNGDTRAVDVPIYQAGVKERRKTTYIADDAGTGRKSVNDNMSMDLTMMSGGELLPYFAKGTEQTGFFRAWRTVTPWWAWPGRGCYSPWAVAPKVMVSAAHYGAGWREGDWTIFDNACQTNFTVRIGSWVTLVSWARAHGFTPAETSVADMGDIKVAPIVQGQIPDACLPCLMDADELAEMFGGDMDGVMAWHYPQGDAETDEGNHYFWCIPVMLRHIGVVTADTPKLPYSTIYWSAASFFGDASAASVREDILSGIGLYDERQWFRIRSGDSGRPCFIRLDYAGDAPVDVPIAQAHWIGGGSSIPAAAKVIRAYSLQVTGLLPKTLLRQ